MLNSAFLMLVSDHFQGLYYVDPRFDPNTTCSGGENTQTQSNNNAVIFLLPWLLWL